MATKNIIVELNKGEKLNGDNYNIWQLKMHYVLEEQDALEAITKVLVQPVTSVTMPILSNLNVIWMLIMHGRKRIPMLKGF